MNDTTMIAMAAFVLSMSLSARVHTAHAGTYYVSTNGDNANDGRSEATAWRTMWQKRFCPRWTRRWN